MERAPGCCFLFTLENGKNGSTGPRPQVCVPPSAKSPVKLSESKNWCRLKEWEGECHLPGVLVAQWKTQREKISIYTTWIWPRTSEPRANLQPQHWLLFLLLGTSSGTWLTSPSLTGLCTMGGDSLRALCHEIPAQGGTAHSLQMQQERGPGNTSTPGPMGHPHHSWPFSFGKGMSFSMNSYQMDLVFSKTSHSRVLFVPFLALRDTKQIILVHHPAGENTPKQQCYLLWGLLTRTRASSSFIQGLHAGNGAALGLQVKTGPIFNRMQRSMTNH